MLTKINTLILLISVLAIIAKDILALLAKYTKEVLKKIIKLYLNLFFKTQVSPAHLVHYYYQYIKTIL